MRWLTILLLLFPVILPALADDTASVVPAGTLITVRLKDAVDTTVADFNRQIQGVLDVPVIVDGKQVAPEGAKAVVSIIRVKAPGQPNDYAIELHKVEIGGSLYPVTTGFAQASSAIVSAPPGEGPEGIAKPGVVLDTITQQGDGAAVATVRGAGVTFQIVRGPELKVAPEMLLNFTLAEPLILERR